MRERFVGNTGAGIEEAQRQILIFPLAEDLQHTGGAYIPAGIFKNIGKYLSQPSGIAPDANLSDLIKLQFHLNTSLGQTQSVARHSRCQHTFRLDRLFV